ncbi:type III polyketide synthase [Halalkalibacillus sediminis]|uniref:Type III polyketide synthase n=1 Tax=Halalkalibacillus sediminis TaxID=2018042 RepID=A0A2I0QXH8_9BACI|nr:3-oxoacyl-[acyl-carrier-protein] synthase III C-terminal domain-containing protein [Halalkalibacillus sediminis]PKR78810.1 type III polyketide synthase [Halalkalibacillus sediminis]
MSFIYRVGTAIPPHTIHQTEAKKFIQSNIAERRLEKYVTVFDQAEITSRYFVVPQEWFEQPHSFSERNELFESKGIDLASKAVDRCLNSASMDHSEIDALFTVTSTGILTPSLDVHLMNRCSFNENIVRVPMFGLGCAGGAVGLARVNDYLKAHPTEAVILVCVELSSVAFHIDELNSTNIVGAALFGDGAAAVLLLGDEHPLSTGGFKMTEASSRTKRESMDIMGWDVQDDGFHVIFSKKIPSLIKTFWKDHSDNFLTDNKITLQEIDSFILHPGGKKVLEEISKCILEEHSLEHSFNILKNFGNMSSPTVLFVLLEKMQQENLESGTKHILGALGPGFHSQLILMEYV